MKGRSRIADVFYVLAIMGTAWGMIWLFPFIWLTFTTSLQRVSPNFPNVPIEHGFVFFLPLLCCLGSEVILLLDRKERRSVGPLFLFLFNAGLLLIYPFCKLLF